MANGTSRLIVVGGVCGASLLVIIGRLWWLQLARWTEYDAQALGNRTAVVYREAPRGLILDRHGRVLADNRDVWRIVVIPSRLPSDEVTLEHDIVAFLASTLSTPEAPVSTAQVRAAIQKARSQRALEAVPLDGVGQDLTFDQMATIEEHRLELPGVLVTTTARRHYPYGRLAAHAIGYARTVTKEQLKEVASYTYPPDVADPTAAVVSESEKDWIYRQDSIIGEQGVESLCELDRMGASPVPILPGRCGRAVYEVDAVGQPQRLVAERDPVPGAEVHLTLDARIQHVAEVALRQAISGRNDGSGAVVVMDVTNGDVLALASEPSCDPNDWVNGFTAEQWAMAQNSPGLPLLNKAIAGAYPPGSVFKIVSACAALETTGLRLSETSYCQGRIYVGRRREPFRCWAADQGGHGAVNLLEAIARSCNVYFYDCVLHRGLDPDRIAEYARHFGLGETTGLGLPGEVAGEVPSPKFSFNITGQPWRLGNSLNFVIGQDRLTVTPLQMSVACAAIANGGRVLTPNLVRRIRWPAYLRRRDTVNELGRSRPLGIRPETLAIVRQGMRLAVTSEHGTARALRNLPVSCAGKTGSAQYRPGKKTHAWFICFAPYEEPRYSVSVFVYGGGAGGEVAAPVAAEVLRALFTKPGSDDPYPPPEPMNPETVARERAKRIAEAKAWAEARRAKADKRGAG